MRRFASVLEAKMGFSRSPVTIKSNSMKPYEGVG